MRRDRLPEEFSIGANLSEPPIQKEHAQPALSAARWAVLSVFLLSSVLNYLDRLTLAHLAPLLEQEFSFSHQEYGYVVSLFALVYAAFSPVAGAFVDRVGLNRGAGVAVLVWSAANVATGFVGGFGGLLAARSVLAAAESAGVPSVGKAITRYLPPSERAMGHAASNIGLGIGAMAAPPLATWFTLHYGWRSAFIATGLMGFVWLPLWLWASRRAPVTPAAARAGAPEPVRQILRSPVMWTVIAANFLGMAPYTLWSNWTTIFLVDETHLTVAAAAAYAPFPPLAANLGGLAGGFASMLLIRAGRKPVAARQRACLFACALGLLTALIPAARTPGWATLGIAVSFFAAAAFSVNLYTVPLDLYGAGRAAFAVSLLTAAYGVTQAVLSPLFGWIVVHWGFQPVCLLVAVLPMGAWTLLRLGGVASAREAA